MNFVNLEAVLVDVLHVEKKAIQMFVMSQLMQYITVILHLIKNDACVLAKVTRGTQTRPVERPGATKTPA